jgi:RecJ-like exonuclease
MKFKFIFLLCILNTAITFLVKAQDTPDSLMNLLYGQAKHHIDKKNYQAANETFKKILNLKTTVPDELAYFYGYTLVNLNKYTLGKQFLKKYIDLRGDTGRYYNYASDMMNLADCKEVGSYFIEEKCAECEGSGKTMVTCRTCNGRGNEICTLCGGIGAIRKRDNFGDTFSTCQKCEGKGDYLCTNCHGDKEVKARCFVCDGKGKVRIKKECDVLLMGQGKQ